MKMIFRYALKNFAKNLGFNIYIIIQLALVFIACIFTCSSINQKLKYYNIYGDMLAEDGYYVSVEGVIRPVEINDKLTLSDLGDYYDEASLLYSFLAPNDSDVDEEYYNYSNWTYAYSGRLIDNFHPLMSEGKWFDESPSKEYTVNAVISPNDLGIGAGDEFTQSFETMDGEIINLTVHVTGVFKDGAKLFGISYGVKSEDMATITDTLLVEDAFHNYYKDIYNELIIIFNYDELAEYNAAAFIEGEGMISLKDGLTEDEKTEAYTQLRRTFYDVISFDDINEATMAELKEQLIILLPIVLGLMLLTVVSILCFTAITTHKQLKNYGTICLCGATLTQCSFINLCEIAIDLFFSALLTYDVFLLSKKFDFFSNTVVSVDLSSIAVLVVVGIVVLIVSMIMPIIITKKNTLNEIVKAEE